MFQFSPAINDHHKHKEKDQKGISLQEIYIPNGS